MNQRPKRVERIARVGSFLDKIGYWTLAAFMVALGLWLVSRVIS